MRKAYCEAIVIASLLIDENQRRAAWHLLEFEVWSAELISIASHTHTHIAQISIRSVFIHYPLL